MIDDHPYFDELDSAAYHQKSLKGDMRFLVWVKEDGQASATLYQMVDAQEHMCIIQLWGGDTARARDYVSYIVGEPGLLELKQKRFLTPEEFDPWRHLPWQV